MDLGSPSCSFISWRTSSLVMRRRRWYSHSWKGTSMAAMRARLADDQQGRQQHRPAKSSMLVWRGADASARTVIALPPHHPRRRRPPGRPWRLALTSSTRPWVENMRPSPCIGSSRVRSKRRTLVVNTQPPTRKGVTSAAIDRGDGSGATVSRASARHCAEHPAHGARARRQAARQAEPVFLSSSGGARPAAQHVPGRRHRPSAR